MTKNDILQKLSQEKEYLQKTYEVDKIGLFGSYAKDSLTASLESLEKRIKLIHPSNSEIENKQFEELRKKIDAITKKLDSLMDESLIDEALDK